MLGIDASPVLSLAQMAVGLAMDPGNENSLDQCLFLSGPPSVPELS